MRSIPSPSTSRPRSVPPIGRRRLPAPSVRALSLLAAAASLTSSRPCPDRRPRRPACNPGDLIDIVDGKPVRNSSLWRVKAALEGPEGSHVEIILFRGGDEKRVTLSIPRDAVRAASPFDALGGRCRGGHGSFLHAGDRGRFAQGRRRGQPARNPADCPRLAGSDRRRDFGGRSRGFSLYGQRDRRQGRRAQGFAAAARVERRAPLERAHGRSDG